MTIDDEKISKTLLDKAIKLRESGYYAEAIKILENKIRDIPADPNIPALLSHCYMLNDDLDKAKIYLDAAKSINPNIAAVGWNEARLLLKRNKVNEALDVAKKTNKLFANDVEGMVVLGSCLRTNGNLNESLKYFDRAIERNPNCAEAFINKGLISLTQNDKVNALNNLEKAYNLKPHIKQIWDLILNLKMEVKKYENVISIARGMLKLSPLNEKIIAYIALCYQNLHKYDQAVLFYKKVIEIKPDDLEAWLNLGSALKSQGKLDEAVMAYNNALAIKPSYAEAFNNIGVTLQDQGKLDEAIEAYSSSLAVKPDYADAYYNMGNALREQGTLEEAKDAYNKAISIKPDYAEAHRNLSSIIKYKEDDNQINQVQKISTQKGLSENTQCHLNFTLAKMYEDVGKLDKAYSHLSEANALRKKLLKYSIKQDQELFTKLKNTQPHLLKNSLQIKEKPIEETPIFILGMPRSGTTLVEQIISSHSEVTGAGELPLIAKYGGHFVWDPSSINRAAVSEFRDSYLSDLSKIADGKQYVTDKMAHNFRFIPLICAAFPEAKIVHVRRNAAATCWSNFKQYFEIHGLEYCYDLYDLVIYYLLYTDLMQFWELQYGNRIYNLNYENLTTDQENQTRKLIKYLDLNWEDACLSPHENKRSVRTASQQQVRQKVYQGSSEAWRKYEPFLNGAFDGLPAS